MAYTKKILLTSLSGQLGGLELRLRDEARFLNNLGHSAELAINPFPEIYPWVEHLKQEGIPFHFFDPPPFFEEWRWRRFNKLRAYLFHRQFYKQRKADLVHVALAWTETGGTRLWLAHKANIPTVISVHNAFPYGEFTSWHQNILFESFQSVKAVYAVSDSALDHFVKIFSRFLKNDTRLEIIYNPVDIHKFQPSEQAGRMGRVQLGMPEHAIVLGVVGRLDEQKRPELFIDVFAALKLEFPDLFLLFIGQGNLEAQCRKKVTNLGLERSVQFTGFQRDVQNILPVLNLHVLLSSLEGFGIATAEAMACGVPVIATDVPGSRDILRNSHAGVLVPKDDFHQIVECLRNLIVDEKKRNFMAQQGPIEVKQRFSSEIIGKKLENFYQNIL
ncbi:MAG: D-inositol-3-phosphate glycosyltransferase [Nitrosomonas europaea]|uniref:glycosyltransferase family 4 protein n=1 Tax=Nitrosomonas europaea TaxID=915 RepID=UPI0023F394DF|nr:glycosyltransferase family 4 protein [Nitrosomonas europaea]MBV6390756.1 D-inositol-3-phosphate glycosyltransferase [Nitrosomonas europaea]